jgi:hypothetical protein
VLSGPFFDFFSIFFVIYTCIRTVWTYLCHKAYVLSIYNIEVKSQWTIAKCHKKCPNAIWKYWKCQIRMLCPFAMYDHRNSVSKPKCPNGIYTAQMIYNKAMNQPRWSICHVWWGRRGTLLSFNDFLKNIQNDQGWARVVGVPFPTVAPFPMCFW